MLAYPPYMAERLEQLHRLLKDVVQFKYIVPSSKINRRLPFRTTSNIQNDAHHAADKVYGIPE